MRWWGLCVVAACGSSKLAPDASPADAPDAPTDVAIDTMPAVSRVFVIVMANRNWSDVKNSTSAPYINALLGSAAHAEQYYNPTAIHPSEPDYIWMIAGSNLGITDDGPPSINHQSTTDVLTSQLDLAHVSWKAYEEDIAGTTCPLTATGNYAPKHDPFVFFDANTGGGSATDPYCLAHVQPYARLATDLAAGTVPQLAFITPNLCDDGYSVCAPQNDQIRQQNDWLASELPKIVQSTAYTANSYVFVVWDQAVTGDGPIGLIAVSPHAKPGYASSIHYTHSSLLRSLDQIFAVSPKLRDAANATDLSDLFVTSL